MVDNYFKKTRARFVSSQFLLAILGAITASVALARDPLPQPLERFEQVELDDNSDALERYFTLQELIRLSRELSAARDRAIAEGLCDDPQNLPEICNPRGTQMVSQGIAVPKHAAPFLVQIARSDFFLEASNVRTINQGRADWELEHVCGGTLIDKEWVLTAAHCFSTKPRANRPPIYTDEYGVRLDVGNIKDTTSEKIAVEAIYLHPDYDVNPTQHDIALVKIKTQSLPLVLRDYKDLSANNDYGHSNMRVQANENGDYAVIAGSKNEVRRANLSTDKIDREQAFSTHIGPNRIKLFPDAVLFWDGNKASLMDVQRWQVGQTFNTVADIQDVIYVPELKRLLTTSNDAQSATLWDSDRGFALGTFVLNQPNAPALGVVKQFYTVRPNRLIMTHAPMWGDGAQAGAESAISIWDITTQEQIAAVRYDGSFRIINPLSPNPSLLYDRGGALIVLNSKDGEPRQNFVLNLRDKTMWQEGGQHLVFVDTDNHILIKDLITGQTLIDFKASAAGFEQTPMPPKIDYDEATGRLLIINAIGQMQIWDTKRQRLILSDDLKMVSSVMHSEFFNDGKSLLIWVEKGRSRIWDLSGNGRVKMFEHSLPIDRVSLSANQRKLITQSAFGTAEVWDIASATAEARIYHGGALLGVEFIRARNMLLTWGGQGRIKSWDIATGQERLDIIQIGPQDRFTPQAMDPDAKPTLISTISTNRSFDLQDEALLTFGWGKTKQAATFAPSAVLMTAGLTPLTPEQCLEVAPQWTFLNQSPFRETIFCGYDSVRKTCKGDSGGPIVNRTSVVGIVSAGSGNCSADYMPGLYTRVDAYNNWIKSVVCTREHSGEHNPKPCT